jgi:hypothetical protein
MTEPDRETHWQNVYQTRVTSSMRMICQSLLAVLSAVILGFGAAHAQTNTAKAPGAAGKVRHVTELRGEWGRNGPGFVCTVKTKEKLPPSATTAEMLARACQHMGPFVIGDDVQVLKATLGPPRKTLPQPNGASAWVYFLGEPDHYPYLMVTVSKNRIVALQVTGTAAAEGYDFNHIDLGIPADAVIQMFGKPYNTAPSEEKDTELWSYGVWPFSFEVRGAHVTSMRINEP